MKRSDSIFRSKPYWKLLQQHENLTIENLLCSTTSYWLSTENSAGRRAAKRRPKGCEKSEILSNISAFGRPRHNGHFWRRDNKACNSQRRFKATSLETFWRYFQADFWPDNSRQGQFFGILIKKTMKFQQTLQRMNLRQLSRTASESQFSVKC